MTCSCSTHSLSFFVHKIFLLLFIARFINTIALLTPELCRPDQRDALLEFKKEFKIGKPGEFYDVNNNRENVTFYPKMESWVNNTRDCCSWDGIRCDAKSREVVGLDLSRSCLHGPFKPNSSLFRLQNLRFLDLSFNDLVGPIPFSLGNLSRLTTLFLSSNNFIGEIPSSLGNLNHLTIFNVASNRFSGNFPVTLLNLTNLSQLSLSFNHFTGTLPPNFTSLYKLEFFDASQNSFVGTIPSSLFNIPSLFLLRLYNNQLSGTLQFGNLSSPSSLNTLHLGHNNLTGPLPRSISKLTNLENLDLRYFRGRVDLSIIFSLLNSITMLDLSGTPVSMENISLFPSRLIELILPDCGIEEFPEFIRTQHHMIILDLSNNKIKGQVPSWIWTFSELGYLVLYNNSFDGFEGSKKDEMLLSTQSTLAIFLGSRNNFTGELPSFICELRSLSVLDLSNNNFNGMIPPCLGNLKRTLSVLNLRENRLSGSLPEAEFQYLKSLDVGHNQLVGKLPRSFIHFSALEVLNVESNGINDTFPFWLSYLPKLHILVLRSNAFHGPIHPTRFPTLRIIDISNNRFTGSLHSDFFVNWSAIGTDEDGSNLRYMKDKFGYYHYSMFLMNKGVRMEMVRILTIYTALDFSGNKLEGEIPKSIGLLKELHVLNLSNNAFTGHIPSSLQNLTELESLDLSLNQLSGEIPQELGTLSLLSYMNFSHNQLVGPVPGGTQFRRQNCSSFENNPGLFGPSIDEVCVRTTSQQSETPEPEREEDEEVVLSWEAALIGFGPGLVFGLTIGYLLVLYKQRGIPRLKKSQKHKHETSFPSNLKSKLKNHEEEIK